MNKNRYINKNCFIEAIQFDGRNLPDIEEFCKDTNIKSVTILNNVLYVIAQVYGQAEFERWSLLMHDYLIKDASGYITTIEEHIILNNWIPFKN